MKPSRRFLSGLLSATLLAGCGYFSEDPSYPPLDSAKLVGCWAYAGAGGSHCEVKCFSQSGLYYSRLDAGGAEARWVETSGTYSTAGRRNAVVLSIRSGYQGHAPDTSLGRFEVNYTLERDTLFSITNNGLDFNPYGRVKLTEACAPHWQVFPKPANWDLE